MFPQFRMEECYDGPVIFTFLGSLTRTASQDLESELSPSNETLNPKSQNPKTQTPNPKPKQPNSKPQTLSPSSRTLNSKP